MKELPVEAYCSRGTVVAPTFFRIESSLDRCAAYRHAQARQGLLSKDRSPLARGGLVLGS